MTDFSTRDSSELTSWLQNNGLRSAQFIGKKIPDNPELKKAIKLGGVTSKVVTGDLGYGHTVMTYIEFTKSPTFSFNRENSTYTQ